MTAWSTTNKQASIGLTNANLTATKGTPNADSKAIADTGYNTGKRVFSIVMNVVSDASPALARGTSATNVYPGDDSTSLSVINGTGIYFNGVTTTPAPTYVNGNTVFMAVDFTNSRFWWRVGTGGQWNGSGTANPDTNVGGFNMSALFSGNALFPTAGFFTNGGQQTLDPTAAGHGLSTFTPWDASGTDGTANGTTLTAVYSLVPGSATGTSNATASGLTLTSAVTLIPGTASGQRNATAAGVTLNSTASLIPGTAFAGGSATANGAVLTSALTLIAGSATGTGSKGKTTGGGAGNRKGNPRDEIERIYAKKRKAEQEERDAAPITVQGIDVSLPATVSPDTIQIPQVQDAVELLLLLA